MEFVRTDKLKDEADTRHQVSLVFVEGFYSLLKVFGKDKTRLIKAFEHMFDLSKFYVAVNDGEIVSLCGVDNGKSKPVALNLDILRKHLGRLRGRWAFWMLNKFIVNKIYPVDIPSNYGTIEFVSAKPSFTGKGITKSLMTHVMGKLDYAGFILEVLGDNTRAIKLYEKLGFSEIHRVKGPKFSGIDSIMYMKYEKTPEGLT